MMDNHKAFLESLITNQVPLNGSYETHWPFNAEDTPRRWMIDKFESEFSRQSHSILHIHNQNFYM